MAKNIALLPVNDRPYEKMELLGPSNLTDSELLAIVIKNGTKNLNCIQIAQNILQSVNTIDCKYNMSNLEYLSTLSMQDLQKFEGIGKIKAIQIIAVIEIAKRISKEFTTYKSKITSPKDIFEYVGKSYIGMKQECLKVVILNKQNNVLAVKDTAIGTNDNINIGIKEILSEPIKLMASAIIITHNHPSGNLIPSSADINFTKKIDKYSKIFNINLLDHIIIANNNYVSLKELKKF